MPLAYSTFTIPFPGGGNTGHAVGTNIYMVVGLTGVYILDTTTDTVTGSVSGFTGNWVSSVLDKTTGRIIMVGPTTAGASTMRVGVIDTSTNTYSTAITSISYPSSDELPTTLCLTGRTLCCFGRTRATSIDIDTWANTTTTIPTRAPAQSYRTDAVPVGSNVWVWGRYGHVAAVSEIEEFDPATGTITGHPITVPPGSGGATDRAATGCFAVGSTIYGFDSSFGWVGKYDTAAHSYSEFPGVAATAYSRSTKVGNLVVALRNQSVNPVDILDVTNDTFLTTPTFAASATRRYPALIGDRFYMPRSGLQPGGVYRTDVLSGIPLPAAPDSGWSVGSIRWGFTPSP